MAINLTPSAANMTPSAANMTPSAASSGSHFDLTGQLDFDTASEALAIISETLESSDNLTLNLSGVSSANSAGLALLIECKSIARRSGKTVSFEAIPESLQKVAEVCQVQDLLA